MKTITSEEVKQRLDNGEDLRLLDVREPEEVAEYSLGGKNIPLAQVQRMETEDIEDWKDKEIICYCRSGKRSAMAIMFLQQMGFDNVKNLEGGAEDFRKKYGEEF